MNKKFHDKQEAKTSISERLESLLVLMLAVAFAISVSIVLLGIWVIVKIWRLLD
jgi:hypothetical protein